MNETEACVVEIDIEKDYTVERAGTNSTKWDGLKSRFGRDGLLPLWVADMDFKAPECVREAIARLNGHGVYGYHMVPDGYYRAFIDWEKRRHGYEVKKEWIRFTAGVVSGLYWFINAMTQKDDACLILTPCYYPFMDAVRDTGRKLVCCDLVNTDGYYTIDFEKFEEAIRANAVKMFLLCSPHNPVGRVWTKEELRNLLEICKKYGVFVLSDEIHQDITFGGHKNIPAAAVGDYDNMLAILTSASKTFNLAGMKNSFAVIPDEAVRSRFDRFVKANRIARGSVFGYAAAEAAYRGGEPWLEKVLEVIAGNDAYLRDELASKLPGVTVTPLEGTYLVWIDLGAYVRPAELREIVQEQCGLAVDYGEWFFENRTDTHIRINLATSGKNIETAVQRLVEALGGGKEHKIK
ncbi:pyridoxal phosphate-dependent aminotransferase [Caproiciproducens galactitolivorans]|uniref:cysteine-S-conjugate beta-lyase n=1 Tax=Caproiciproducens galactitolivorans TaxID=642589 RepID=A0ABT4BV20_9FIRM|nr:pyridoxal phosphate-dependent aminotransferase [Caproiciproducens galactitolivorans]